jgi:ATP-dependent protease ClpP protease subunit
MKDMKKMPVIAMTLARAAEKTAELTIEGEIGWYEYDGEKLIANTAPAIRRQLDELMNMEVDHITVNIHSLGGFVDDALAIHDALAMHPASVTTRVTGFTASAATIIAQAADPGQREISSNAMYLVHESWGVAIGTTTQMLSYIEMLDTLNDQMALLYAKRAGSDKDKEKYRSIMAEKDGAGKWITADKAVELGFADKAFEPMKAAASANGLAMLASAGVHLPEGVTLPEPPADPPTDPKTKQIDPGADSGAVQYAELITQQAEILTLKFVHQ